MKFLRKVLPKKPDTIAIEFGLIAALMGLAGLGAVHDIGSKWHAAFESEPPGQGGLAAD